MTDEYDCNIVANNNTDFVIADNITSGNVPVLLGGMDSAVGRMNFDIDECCKNNDFFRVKLKITQANLNNASSLSEKFEIMQRFMEDLMPLCEPNNFDKRTGCIFDGEPFSCMVDNKFCMCAERAAMAQYLCQQCGIKSYFVNSYVQIKNGEEGQHAYVIFEDNNQMFVYDPANPTKDNAPRIMSANMDKTVFADFVDAVNHNADCQDKTQKNRVGFICQHADGKKFLYRSYCGTMENRMDPQKLKEIRLAKAVETQMEAFKNGNTKK